MAGIQRGELVLTAAEVNNEKKQADGKHDIEEGQIEEEQATYEDRSYTDMVRQFDLVGPPRKEKQGL